MLLLSKSHQKCTVNLVYPKGEYSVVIKCHEIWINWYAKIFTGKNVTNNIQPTYIF